jgi:hypothetical protein
MISIFKKESPEVKAKRQELSSWKEQLNILNATVEKAKSDLKSGVDRKWVEENLKSNSITKEAADEVLNSISVLESIINFSSPNIESLKEKIKMIEEEIKQLKI